jgi:branched-chain amino acid transport system permease protein
VFGSIVGAALLTVLPQLLSQCEGWETVVYGVILVVCMIFLPRGLVPTLASRRRPARTPPPAVPAAVPAMPAASLKAGSK